MNEMNRFDAIYNIVEVDIKQRKEVNHFSWELAIASSNSRSVNRPLAAAVLERNHNVLFLLFALH